jgi:glycosyltransferase involved in cell wall biosynthesis
MFKPFMEDLLTVVMPVYNGERYLEEALKSVVNQSYQNWHLIIVDDGSTDGSPVICERYEKEDARIKYVRYVNQRVTPPENWNRAFRLATTDYIMMFHQDDIMHPELLEHEFKFMVDNPEVTWVSCRGPLIDLKSNFILRNNKKVVKPATFDKWNFETDQIFEGQDVSNLIIWRVFFHASACMLRRSTALRIPLFDQNLLLLFDAEYYSRLSELGKVGYISNELIYYRHHSNSGMSNTYNKGLNGIEAYYMMSRFCDRHNFNEQQKAAFRKEYGPKHAQQALRLAKTYFDAGDRTVANMQVMIALWFCEWADSGKEKILSKWLSFRFTRSRFEGFWLRIILITSLHRFYKGSLTNPFDLKIQLK